MYKKLLYFLIIITNSFYPYQELFINGRTIEPGHRPSSKEYEFIKPILDMYRRPITVLDLAAAKGYFSFRIAFEYDAVCVMIEREKKKLLDLCYRNNTLSTVLFCHKSFSVKDLNNLSDCEHFDVVLALDIIHWFDKDWKLVTDSILKLGDNIFIAIPPEGAPAWGGKYLKSMNDYLIFTHHAKILGSIPRPKPNDHFKENIYWIQKHKISLRKPYWSDARIAAKIFKIESNFEDKNKFKRLNNNRTVMLEWKPGINLRTFQMLNGIFPSKKDLNVLLRDKIKVNRDNLIIQGEKIISVN